MTHRSKTKDPIKRWCKVATALGVVLLMVTGNLFVHQTHAERTELEKSLGPVLADALSVIGNGTAPTTDRMGITGQDCVVSFTHPIKPSLAWELPIVRDTAIAPKEIKVLKRQGFIVGYAPQWRHPAWVIYEIPPLGNRSEASPPRPDTFSEDPEVKSSPRTEDYTDSGYDRGHNAPNYAIATRFGKTAQRNTFLMSNISPQCPDLNQGPWMRVEQLLARELSRACGSQSIWVIVGSVPSTKTLPKSKIEIPKGFYQIAFTFEDNGTKLKAFAVYMEQEIARGATPRMTFRSIDEIEAMSGLDFFASLPDEQEDLLEKQEATRFWPFIFNDWFSF